MSEIQVNQSINQSINQSMNQASKQASKQVIAILILNITKSVLCIQDIHYQHYYTEPHQIRYASL